MWRVYMGPTRSYSTFQSTHPYGMWLGNDSQDEKHEVSIHTSLRDVTCTLELCICRDICVSIHTSLRDVTRLYTGYGGTSYVSIHTSLRDVTPMDDEDVANGMKFQSTHPYGMWPAIVTNGMPIIMFQSTHPYGMWPVQEILHHGCVMFQSTHPYGMWLCSSFCML